LIKARRLFLLPSLSMFFLLIPFVGIFFTLAICIYWYSRNQQDIHLYFRGVNYNQDEINKKELEDLK